MPKQREDLEKELSLMQEALETCVNAGDVAGMARANAKLKNIKRKLEKLNSDNLQSNAKQPVTTSLAMLLVSSLEGEQSQEATDAFIQATKANGTEEIDLTTLGKRLKALRTLNQQERQLEAEAIVNGFINLSNSSADSHDTTVTEQAILHAWQSIVTQLEVLEESVNRARETNQETDAIQTKIQNNKASDIDLAAFEKSHRESVETMKKEFGRFWKFLTQTDELTTLEKSNLKESQ